MRASVFIEVRSLKFSVKQKTRLSASLLFLQQILGYAEGPEYTEDLRSNTCSAFPVQEADVAALVRKLGHLLLILVAVGCQRESPSQPAPPAWDDIAATADGKLIQGIWKQVAGGDPSAAGATWTFTGSEIKFRLASLAQDQAGMIGTYQLKSSVAPKQMNWKYPGLRESFAIYSLDGDTLKICVDGNPTSFDRPTKLPADGSIGLLILERQRSLN